jgi:hypothetical protein
MKRSEMLGTQAELKASRPTNTPAWLPREPRDRKHESPFFLKKAAPARGKQNTFSHIHLSRGASPVETALLIRKSSLVLSFKKERLAFPFLTCLGSYKQARL